MEVPQKIKSTGEQMELWGRAIKNLREDPKW
jgi:hypothetical protein